LVEHRSHMWLRLRLYALVENITNMCGCELVRGSCPQWRITPSLALVALVAIVIVFAIVFVFVFVIVFVFVFVFVELLNPGSSSFCPKACPAAASKAASI
jgi:hypothetical protein